MKRANKTETTRGVARDLFAELREGIKALTDARQGKRKLLTHAVEFKPTDELLRRRKQSNCLRS